MGFSSDEVHHMMDESPASFHVLRQPKRRSKSNGCGTTRIGRHLFAVCWANKRLSCPLPQCLANQEDSSPYSASALMPQSPSEPSLHGVVRASDMLPPSSCSFDPAPGPCGHLNRPEPDILRPLNRDSDVSASRPRPRSGLADPASEEELDTKPTVRKRRRRLKSSARGTGGWFESLAAGPVASRTQSSLLPSWHQHHRLRVCLLAPVFLPAVLTLPSAGPLVLEPSLTNANSTSAKLLAPSRNRPDEAWTSSAPGQPVLHAVKTYHWLTEPRDSDSPGPIVGQADSGFWDGAPTGQTLRHASPSAMDSLLCGQPVVADRPYCVVTCEPR
ncbi:unnamed protein product [Protopolystoma xenopodis]|uniref:Uncharacterized protein n=1 Tax=Protopolystoma xenopodis TaxID=117903 RepID=A0A3S5AYR5_9PLAT|nr:unnamed protein product [Protopolystoma xenopodis]